MNRALSLALVGVLAGSVAGCGSGENQNGPPPPPTSRYAGVAYSLVQGRCAGVGVLVPGHRSTQTAEEAARQRCQQEASNLATQLGSLHHLCRSVWTDECVAIYGGKKNTGRCVVSGAHGSSVAGARSSALGDCQSTLGFGAQCDVIVAGCASGATPLTGVWKSRDESNPGTSGRFNAIAASAVSGACEERHYGSVALNFSDSASADAEALRLCRQEGGTGCRIQRRFGSYYSSNNNCAALAIVVQTGFGFTSCSFTAELGNTVSQAEQAALTSCRRFGSNNPNAVRCSIVVGARGSRSRGRVSGCEQ